MQCSDGTISSLFSPTGCWQRRRMPPIESDLHRWIAETSLPNLYAICAALILAAWLIYWIGRDVWRWAWRRRQSRIRQAWRRFAHVHLPKVMARLDIPKYRPALLLAVMLAANVFGLRFRTHSWTEAQKRAGSLAVINLIPLCTGVSFGLPAHLLHVDRHMLAWFHRWVGRICMLHSILHGSLLVSVARKTSLASPRYVVPIAVGIELLGPTPSIYVGAYS